MSMAVYHTPSCSIILNWFKSLQKYPFSLWKQDNLRGSNKRGWDVQLLHYVLGRWRSSDGEEYLFYSWSSCMVLGRMVSLGGRIEKYSW